MSADIDALRARLEWLCDHLPVRVRDGFYDSAVAWKNECQKSRSVLRARAGRVSVARAIARMERFW